MKDNRTSRRGWGREREFDAALLVRCTDEQREAWEAAADGEGAGMAEWAREALDAAAARAARKPDDCE